jgi:hypothetical protein
LGFEVLDGVGLVLGRVEAERVWGVVVSAGGGVRRA